MNKQDCFKGWADEIGPNKKPAEDRKKKTKNTTWNTKTKEYQDTVSEHQCHTPSREERRFLYFNHLSKEFLEQMIPHLKALM